MDASPGRSARLFQPTRGADGLVASVNPASGQRLLVTTCLLDLVGRLDDKAGIEQGDRLAGLIRSIHFGHHGRDQLLGHGTLRDA
jgi:hypothetical protein